MYKNRCGLKHSHIHCPFCAQLFMAKSNYRWIMIGLNHNKNHIRSVFEIKKYFIDLTKIKKNQ